MKPRLAKKVHVPWDENAGRSMLVAPNRGIALDDTTAAIALLCDGSHTIEDIAREVEAEDSAVQRFVESLALRGLVRLV